MWDAFLCIYSPPTATPNTSFGYFRWPDSLLRCNQLRTEEPGKISEVFNVYFKSSGNNSASIFD